MAANRMERSGQTPRWSVVDSIFSTEDMYARFVVMCNHVRYVVHVRETALSWSPELREKLKFFLKVAENTELDGYTVNDFHNWALKPLLPILCENADVTPWPRITPPTLRDFLYAPIMEYRLVGVSEMLLLNPEEDTPETRFMFGVRRPGICTSWPRYVSVHLGLDPREGTHSVPCKVFLPNGTAAFFKLLKPRDAAALNGAFTAHGNMLAAQLRESIRIPRLLGIVVRGDDRDAVLGLLLTYIARGSTTLRTAVDGDAPVRLRRRWAKQVMQMVHDLHQNDLIWGYAGPDNVIIDGNENAWLAGFEGGQSSWVPKELEGTMDGDLVALKRIVDYSEEGVSFYSR